MGIELQICRKYAQNALKVMYSTKVYPYNQMGFDMNCCKFEGLACLLMPMYDNVDIFLSNLGK